MTNNPLLQNWDTPFGLPPFDLIKTEHFSPAFNEAFAQSRAAVAKIADHEDAPSFANTIDAMEQADALLDKVAGVFYNLSGTMSDDALDALMMELSPKMAAYSSEILMNTDLFARVDALIGQELNLTSEQARVLKLYHQMFTRAGAKLDDVGKARLTEIMSQLATLGTQFTQNLLADEKAWSLPLSEDDLEGLPEDLRDALSSAASERGKNGYLLTLSRSVLEPFLSFSPRRDLRAKAQAAFEARGANGNAHDNRALVAQMLELRAERAALLGFDSFADFKLAPEMAGTPQAVRDLLMQVWEPARAAAERDAARYEAMMTSEGEQGPLLAHDWRYYADRVRRADFALDQSALKPYFTLENMIEAAFDVSNRLFGLSYEPLDVALYHPDCKAWEVKQGDRHMGVFVGDYFARPSKRSGAWCSTFRSQNALGDEQRPHVVNVCNFAKASKGPNLLTWDDVRTLFHEFGHALHQLMSDVTYGFVSGTSVARDFVELPSQLYEHWMSEPEILRAHARHHATNEIIPQDLLDKLLAAENFDQGFATVEFLTSAIVDLEFHAGPAPKDPMQRQAEILESLNTPAAIPMRHATPQFAHVFSGDGYSSGYYSYMWSEVMDADAFAAFKETGNAFDPALAEKLSVIYSSGGSVAPEQLYTDFRGKMPDAGPLLIGRGLVEA